MNQNKGYPIDFVLSWMDPHDENWRRKKAKYWGIEIKDPNYDENQVARFRDWDNLQYWFRGVERFAPWVRSVFFVTWDTVPVWLNTEHPKLRIIRDREIIPEGCAPAFSPNPMETNLHRIPDLSEHFVYFNDDMFLLDSVSPETFYHKGLPREMAVAYQPKVGSTRDPFQQMLQTMLEIINSSFSKEEVQRKNLLKWYTPKYGKQLINTIRTAGDSTFTGIMIPHLPSAMRKSTYEEVWNAIPEQLTATAHHRFRDGTDVTQYIFRYWAICKGSFTPTDLFRSGKEFFMNEHSLTNLCDVIRNRKMKMICINDSKDIRNFEKCRDDVKDAFRSIFPEPSSFEKRKAK